MENIVRNVSDIPLQPEGSYLSCLNSSSSQYKAPRSYQINKLDESVDKTTNCKAGEGTSTIAPEADDSSWSSRSRDWSEEVERATGDAENELNSSPQQQVTTESERLSDIKRKQTLRSPQNVCNDVSKYGGIGRGKHRVKPPHLQNIEFDRRVQDNSMLCNNAETNSDLPPVNTMQTVHVENNSPSCNSSHLEDIGCDDAPKDSMKKSPIFQDTDDANILPVQGQLNGAYSLQGDARTRNVSASNMDHVRDYDYKKIQNGIDTFHRGYRNKPFRMNRMPNNNGSNQLAYKGFDNRTFPHRFPPPMQSNLKGYSRGVKGHENHYRHHDNRRHQPSSRQPFPVAIDKMVYTKHKGNVYAEREFSVFDVNRNFQSPNYSIQNEINRHITGSGSYVPQTNVAAFRTKHNVPRIGNCDKIMCNKNEPPGNAKAWHGGNVYTDSNTSTVSCHNRTVVTPVKSMVPRGHCAICTSHPHAKHCPSLKEENVHSEKVEFPDSCENFNPEQHPQTYGVISKVEQSTKLNCSPDYNNIRDSRIPPNDSNYNIASSRERLSVNDLANSNCGYLPSSDPETKSHLLEKARSPDKNAPCLREKMVFPSMHLRKDLHSEKTETSPKMSPGNVPMSKQPSADFSDSDSSHNLMFLGDSHYMSSPVSAVPHSSYADVIRMPANTASKVSSCQMSNCVETAGPKNEYTEMTHEKVQAKVETEHPNSSEWIMSRLSQIDMNAGNLTNVNGIPPSHQMASNVQQSVNPRPIAVSLEKPSFYNSKVAVGNLQQSNLSSPERRILECQYVEEHLSNVVAYKKSGEKLTFLSDLVSSGEHSSTSIPGNIRTDSTFSDSSSVCSSMSGTFKADGHCQMLKPNTPPVIIMNNYGPTEDIQELSFGIEMDEIMKLCGESDVDSVGDSPMTVGDSTMMFLSDSGFCTGKSYDVAACEVGVLNEETCILEKEDNVAARYITVGNKKFLWKDDVDVSKCNMPQIVGFLQDSVGESTMSPVKFYSEE